METEYSFVVRAAGAQKKGMEWAELSSPEQSEREGKSDDESSNPGRGNSTS
jgi:hypothetical protein